MTDARNYRIAHILPWASIGGVEHATLRVAQAVDPSRFSNIAFCLPEADPVRALFRDAGFETVNYPVAEPSVRHAGAYLRCCRQLAEQLREHRIDLVHCADLLAGHRTSLGGRFAGVPVICHIRNRFSEISRRDRLFIRPVDKFAFVSRDTWRRFGYKVRESRGAVIYDGLDVPQLDAGAAGRTVRSEFGIGSEETVVGMAARVAPQKDYPTLIKAAQMVVQAAPNARFLVVGDNATAESYRQHYGEVRQQIEAAGLQNRFIFTGPRNDAVQLIAGMDIFVLSTHQEGLPLVIIEAMAQGRPVVATDIDGIPEIVEQGRTGYLCAHGDAADLAKRILELVADRDLARVFGDAARACIKCRFSREQFGKSVMAMYLQVLGRADAARW